MTEGPRVAQRRWIFVVVGVALLLVAGYLFQASLNSLASDWAYGMTGLRALQDRGLDGAGVTVAIVDTGFDAKHPALSGIRLAGWKDLVGGQPQPYDDAGHGSHVAGILAGKGATFLGRLQGLNMKGAAPGISLLAIKAISAEGTGTASNVAAGIEYATQRGADIICLSLGSKAGRVAIVGDDITNAVRDATGRGILVVAAAGNTGLEPGRTDVESPASITDVVAVGAVDRSKRVADFSAKGNSDSNYGVQGPTGRIAGTASRQDPDKKPEIVAPGVDMLSAWTGGSYRIAQGTSQAAPLVCGAFALMLEAKPQLKSDNTGGLIDRVKNALKNTAEPVPSQQRPHDPRAGYGLLRAERLVDAV